MKTKRILALFLAVVTCLSLAVSASAASISDFKDVDTKAWYAEAVFAAVNNGLLYGKSKTQLDPNGLLTRAEMAAITNRSFGCYVKADISAYKDVSKNKWYYADVERAVQMGTYNGVSSTSMQPDRAITRQEAIAVVARALQLDLDDYAKTDLSKFADAKEVSAWALPYMRAMVAAGYVHGRTQGLVPQANITRAEFAQLYFNIIQSYITKSGSYTKDYKGNLLVRTKDVELKDIERLVRLHNGRFAFHVPFHVKDVLLVGVGQVLVTGMLRDIKLIAEKRTHPSKLQNTLAAVHNCNFVLGHQLLS